MWWTSWNCFFPIRIDDIDVTLMIGSLGLPDKLSFSALETHKDTGENHLHDGLG